MSTEKQEVRNNRGTLLCETAFVNGRWYVVFKNHGNYTLLELAPTGAAKITNYEPGVKL